MAGQSSCGCGLVRLRLGTEREARMLDVEVRLLGWRRLKLMGSSSGTSARGLSLVDVADGAGDAKGQPGSCWRGDVRGCWK